MHARCFRLISNFHAKNLLNLVHKISGVCLRFLLVANVGCESLSSTVVIGKLLYLSESPIIVKQFRVMYIHSVWYDPKDVSISTRDPPGVQRKL